MTRRAPAFSFATATNAELAWLRWRSRLRRLAWFVIMALAIWALFAFRQGKPLHPPRVPYAAELYAGLIDADGDCQNTRDEVLIRSSLLPAKLSADGCRVLSGRWFDPWRGVLLADVDDVAVVSLIPAAEAHRSGADYWTARQRRRFVNDLRLPSMLLAVSKRSAFARADGDPVTWMPAWNARCAYVRQWREVKRFWKLDSDFMESAALGAWTHACQRHWPERVRVWWRGVVRHLRG